MKKEKNLKIAMLQLNFTVGDIGGNCTRILDGYYDACRNGAELVVSTELCSIGYPPKDLLKRRAYLIEQDQWLERLRQKIGNVGLIISIIVENLKDGKPYFNEAVLIENGRITPLYRKSLLPNYDVFDERRFFEPGNSRAGRFEYRGGQYAILICEDIWGGVEDSRGKRLYREDPIVSLIGEDIDALITLNASPYYWGKGDFRFKLVSDLAKDLDTTVIYVNQVGGNDDLIFDGRSFAVNREGQCIGKIPAFREGMRIVDTQSRDECCYYSSDTNSLQDLYDALVLATKDYINKSGFRKVLIGLSGGIDSALVAAIAVEAVGAERVIGVTEPSSYSSRGSVLDAKKLAKNLCIKMMKIPIKSAFSAFKRMFVKAGVPFGGVAEENLQARIRGSINMFLSNTEGCLVLTTGNKSEISVGYCTLYGDTAGGFAVISDVPKTVVYDLARHVNRLGEVIPNNTITKAPSAELAPGQKDTDSLPPYPILDAILKAYIEDGQAVDEIKVEGANQEEIEKIARMVDRNEYKRRQMALGPKVTEVAFGSGWRFPLAAKYQ